MTPDTFQIAPALAGWRLALPLGRDVDVMASEHPPRARCGLL